MKAHAASKLDTGGKRGLSLWPLYDALLSERPRVCAPSRGQRLE